MRFSELDFDNIKSRGYDKTVVHRNGQLVVGGRTENIVVYRDILKDKTVTDQYGDFDVWMIEIKD